MAILISGTCDYYFTWPKGVGIALHFPDGTQAQYKERGAEADSAAESLKQVT